MVRVITIRDDVYAKLNKLKKSKGMSFSEAIDYLVSVSQEKRTDSSIMEFAGVLGPKDVDEREFITLKRWLDGKNLP
ncbi:MAG: antitoxin VapB family protein [Candidatus Anstonellales archaeon]